MRDRGVTGGSSSTSIRWSIVPRSVVHCRVSPTAGTRQLTGFGTPRRNSNGRVSSIRAWRKCGQTGSGRQSNVHCE
ncbi:hypothetical protein DF051_38005 [Burkholderia contaminans]|uniref:Uncharacterized protein n=1 Tax=Burkholderia contaminans TaxID=488447 RepID=A0A3N8Q8J3_9BURK|nr:hypothetical protein DF051_38005 [Burkholderia contaminans]